MNLNIKSGQTSLSPQPSARVETVGRSGGSHLVPMCSGARSGEIQLLPSRRTDRQNLIDQRSAFAAVC